MQPKTSLFNFLVFTCSFLALFCASNFKAHSQIGDSEIQAVKLNPDTSSLRAIINMADLMRYSNPDSSLIILDNILHPISIITDRQIKADYLDERGATLTHLGEYDEAIINLERAKEIYISLNSIEGVASSNTNLGNTYFYQGKTEQALEFYIEAENGFLECGNLGKAVIPQQGQGVVFLRSGNFAMALSIFKKSEKTAKEAKADELLLYNFDNIASAYRGLGYLDTAAMYYELAGKGAKRKGIVTLEISSFSNLASVYLQMNMPEKSIELLQQNLLLAQEIGDLRVEISILNNLTRAYTIIGDYTNASNCINDAISLANTINSRQALLPLMKSKAELLYKSGKSDEAFIWLKNHMNLKDSLWNSDNQKLTAELQAEHDEFKNQQQIASLEKDNLITNQQLEISQTKQANFYYLLIGSSVIAIILIIALLIYFSQNKKLNQKNKIIEENLKEKEMLLMEVHHRVKNNLQMIYSILNMQTKDASEEAAALLHENKDRIRSISIIHEKLYMNEDITHANLNDLFREISENASKTSQHGADTKIDVQCDPLKLDMDTLISLGILVNELVTNSLKYAFKSGLQNKISISLKKSGDEKISLAVADNGTGFPTDFSLAKTTSFGFRMIQTMCKKLKGEIFVENTNGAVVKIDIHRFKTAS